MDMEELSKSQIVLLTLLTSFVTSIATGIVTVSLMDQAPPAIAQTVNRIIERTVEKVVPSGQTAATVVTQEKTIIVKESELISKALERVNPSIVRLYSNNEVNPIFLGLGVVVDGSGTVAGDSAVMGGATSAMAELADKSRVRAFISSADATTGLVYFAMATTTVDGKPVVWTPVSVAAGQPILGETVVALAGKSVARIGAGLVTTLTASGGEGSFHVIETDITPDSIIAGSPLINTDGSLLGIHTSVARAVSAGGFIPTTVLMKGEKKAEGTKLQ